MTSGERLAPNPQPFAVNDSVMQQHSLSICLLIALGSSAFAQTSFDNDRLISPAFTPPGILTEGFPGAPVVAIPAVAMGLGPLDEAVGFRSSPCCSREVRPRT